MISKCFVGIIYVAVFCGDLGKPANGSFNGLVGSNNTVAIGTVITYMCFPGFKLVGNVYRVCQPSGEWNGTVPICQSNLW